MSNRIKPDFFDQRGGCDVPVGISDLCRSVGCSCDEEIDLTEIDLTEWDLFLEDGTPPEGYEVEELEALMEAQEAIESAWEEMQHRTCGRFRPGECLVARLCEPSCFQSYCDPCGSPWSLWISELLTHVDFREVSQAQFFEYDSTGTLTKHAVDLPGALPSLDSSWRLDGDRSRLSLSPQRPDGDTDLPDLPEQDLSVVFGGPETSALVLSTVGTIPPIVKRAVIDLVNDYLDACHASACKIGDRVSTATNDGKTYILNDPDAERPQKSVQLSETLYGCKRHGEFWRHDMPDAVRDVRWVCCSELD